MRIVYVTQTRFPTEKAHGFQVAQVCDALATLGHEVTLLAPTVRNTVLDAAHSYYGLPESFHVKNLRQFDALNARFIPDTFAFVLSMASYRRHLKRELAVLKPDFLYARSHVVLPALLPAGVPVILELHTLPRFRQKKFVEQCNKCARVVCLTTPMRDELVSMGVDAKRVLVEPDGVNPKRFENLPEPVASAKHWKLPHGRTIVGYVGSLVTQDTLEKGAGELLHAVAELKRRGHAVTGWIVGGPKHWLEHYRDEAKLLGLTEQEFVFHHSIAASLVPSALAAIDVCVYPAPRSDHPFFQRDTSPLKLLEYLAAGRPVVSADLPPVHDIVNEDLVWFSEQGNPLSLADAIENVIEQPEEAIQKAERGREAMQQFSWVERMRRILSSLHSAKASKAKKK